jgi:hypothetical protein
MSPAPYCFTTIGNATPRQTPKPVMIAVVSPMAEFEEDLTESRQQSEPGLRLRRIGSLT